MKLIKDILRYITYKDKGSLQNQWVYCITMPLSHIMLLMNQLYEIVLPTLDIVIK